MNKQITILSLLITFGVASGPAHAEGARVDITPVVGAFNATQNNVDEEFAGIGAIEAKFAGGTAFGGYLTIWLNDNFAIEGAGHFVGSSLDAVAFGAEGELGANIFYGTGRAVLGMGQGPQFQVSAGFGMRSVAFDSNEIENSTFGTGVIGGALLVPLGKSTSLRVGIDNYIYTTYWEVGDLRTSELDQQDIVYSVGLTLHSGK